MKALHLPLSFSLILQCLLTLKVMATPDWSSSTNEEYLGSSDQLYAVIQTTTDNRANHYATNETKTLLEYKKSDNTLISKETISDITYQIDVEHLDPNSPPKISKIINYKNETLSLATLSVNYHKPPVSPTSPEWKNLLSWKPTGIYLGDNLLILSKANIMAKNLPYQEMIKKPLVNSIESIHSDSHCIYLSLKHGDAQVYDNHVFRISPLLTKQILDQSGKMQQYLLISEHSTRELANTTALELLSTAKEKEQFLTNLEIWSTNTTPETLTYLLVHRPFINPIPDSSITELNKLLASTTEPISSDAFIQKWFPYQAEDTKPKP